MPNEPAIGAILSTALPGMHIGSKGGNIKNIPNRFGNKRLWPSGFNREDQDSPAGDKLASTWLSGREGWKVLSDWPNNSMGSIVNPLLPASSIDPNQLSRWTSTPSKPVKWDQNTLDAFLKATIAQDGGGIKIYQELFKVLEPGLKCALWSGDSADGRLSETSTAEANTENPS